jgi:hypothetical protein
VRVRTQSVDLLIDQLNIDGAVLRLERGTGDRAPWRFARSDAPAEQGDGRPISVDDLLIEDSRLQRLGAPDRRSLVVRSSGWHGRDQGKPPRPG